MWLAGKYLALGRHVLCRKYCERTNIGPDIQEHIIWSQFFTKPGNGSPFLFQQILCSLIGMNGISNKIVALAVIRISNFNPKPHNVTKIEPVAYRHQRNIFQLREPSIRIHLSINSQIIFYFCPVTAKRHSHRDEISLATIWQLTAQFWWGWDICNLIWPMLLPIQTNFYSITCICSMVADVSQLCD